jgi:hypothetical protein
MEGAISVKDLAKKLKLYEVAQGRKWNIQQSIATTGDGIYEGLDWISRNLNSK